AVEPERAREPRKIGPVLTPPPPQDLADALAPARGARFRVGVRRGRRRRLRAARPPEPRAREIGIQRARRVRDDLLQAVPVLSKARHPVAGPHALPLGRALRTGDLLERLDPLLLLAAADERPGVEPAGPPREPPLPPRLREARRGLGRPAEPLPL